ncbi:hypothetical protein [Paludifilum halophilum]|uniref:Uncharacterized protein n=1 Tax=Paludifilum halophilum TaxID=1642702 RepID=A0A235B5C3_9BACL|nr:hypothetical protein [Paludifilum halophilum]OYD07510.1 hypothetical protein CHM34_11490 [Paludifilum halophilum]
MNVKAAAFASRLTGVVGILASFLLWKMYGPGGLIIGLIGSSFWFGLGWYVVKKPGTRNVSK